MFPGTKETPYELNAENRFTELENPFEEGVRLFEEGQIADAALCFEAEIARNPENSQVWVDLVHIFQEGVCIVLGPRFLGLLVFRFASCRGCGFCRVSLTGNYKNSAPWGFQASAQGFSPLRVFAFLGAYLAFPRGMRLLACRSMFPCFSCSSFSPSLVFLRARFLSRAGVVHAGAEPC